MSVVEQRTRHRHLIQIAVLREDETKLDFTSFLSVLCFFSDSGLDEILLPPEVCFLTGTSKALKKNFQLMKKVRDISSLTPRNRFDDVTLLANRLSKVFKENWWKS